MSNSLNIDKLVAYAKSQPLELKVDQFYFLRHGQTPCNAAKIFQTYAEPLSELGVKQASEAAEVLAHAPVPVKTICVSDATRTLQTAAPIAAALGITPLATPNLRERHFGDLHGTSSLQIDWDCKPANGETLTEFVDRTRAAIDGALSAGHEDPVLIVAHGGNLLVLASLLNMTVDYKMFGNALPLHFTRHGDTWAATPLLPPTTSAGELGA
jgi:probable phosphoglycerate mutase